MIPPPTSLRSLYMLSKAFRLQFQMYPANQHREVLKMNQHLLLEYYRSGPTDWKKYISPNSIKYNKLWVTDSINNPAFGIAILTWLPGQETPVHGHPENGCLLMPLHGMLDECRMFRSLVPGESKVFNNTIITRARYVQGQVSYIDNREGLHKIKNNGDELAVSLHVYSPICEIEPNSNGLVAELKQSTA